MLNISLCPSPVLYPYYKTEREEYTVVIVDIFRAGTTITTALMNGAAGIIPIATVEANEERSDCPSLVSAMLLKNTPAKP